MGAVKALIITETFHANGKSICDGLPTYRNDPRADSACDLIAVPIPGEYVGYHSLAYDSELGGQVSPGQVVLYPVGGGDDTPWPLTNLVRNHQGTFVVSFDSIYAVRRDATVQYAIEYI